MHRDHRGWGLRCHLRDSRVIICGTLGSLVRLWGEVCSRRPRGLRRYFWKRREERRQRKNNQNHKKKKNVLGLIVGLLGRFSKGLSEVQGGPGGRARIARGPSDKPIPGQKWQGTHRRSSFTKRNVFTTVCRLCKSCVLTWGIVHLE